MADLDTITITRGEDAGRVLTITKNGQPLNLADLTVTWEAFSAESATVLDLGPYTATVLDAAAGRCQVDMPSADTADLELTAYLWEAWVEDLGGKVVEVARGVLHVLASPGL